MKAAISFVGVQDGQRHGHFSDREEFPHIAKWRCNLTGLSQRNNLLFVAFTGQIYVYEPHFPSQALPSKPTLVIDATPSRPSLSGTLDPQNPRGINYLVIQDLGLEEIVAVARDDGDVEAYLVAHVVHAVERCAAGEVAEVLPFFQSNVGLSAWGLAIHSNARIIAASSNTHNVTVFKFGLVQASGEEDESSRRRDVTQSMVNGTTNIPCICFCNTGDDPDGRWLMTTDIVGSTRAIDLHETQLVQKFSFAPSGNQWLHDRIHAGWTIAFLDRRSFVEESDFEAALGRGHAVNANDDQIWDLGRTVSCRTFGGEADFTMYQGNIEAESTTPAQTTENNDNVEIPDSDSDSGSEFDGSDDQEWNFLNIRPIKQNSQANFCGDLPCPILHTSVKNAYLLQPTRGPIVGFSDVLYQELQTADRLLNMFERLNMMAYIPSIGVVVLASQKGRAIILSLTKLLYKSKMTYAMRVDHILPSTLQEQHEERPMLPLMGIAVGPIQGTERLREDQKRWRLLMTYYDHTILSYEIKRGRAEDPSSRVESVVV
jgi:hypothetical protein